MEFVIVLTKKKIGENLLDLQGLTAEQKTLYLSFKNNLLLFTTAKF